MLPQSGSERRYFRLFARLPEGQGNNESVIGTYGANLKENETFLYFTKEFRKKNLPVPEIFIVSDDNKFYLQEDFGDVSLLNLLESDAVYFGRRAVHVGDDRPSRAGDRHGKAGAIARRRADGAHSGLAHHQRPERRNRADADVARRPAAAGPRS